MADKAKTSQGTRTKSDGASAKTATLKTASKASAKPDSKSSKTTSKSAIKTASKSKTIARVGKKSVAVARRATSLRIAAFIDLDNTNASADNLAELVSILNSKGEVVFCKAYGYTDDKVDEFAEVIAEYQLETAGKMRLKSGDYSVIDLRLVLDSVEIAEGGEADTIFIWTGVGDLVPLFTKLQALGMKTMTVDFEGFDTNNKFIDERVHLFSAHTPVLVGMRRSVPSASKPGKQGEDSEKMSEFGPLVPDKESLVNSMGFEIDENPVTAADNERLFEMTLKMISEGEEEREEALRKRREREIEEGLIALKESGEYTEKDLPELAKISAKKADQDEGEGANKGEDEGKKYADLTYVDPNSSEFEDFANLPTTDESSPATDEFKYDINDDESKVVSSEESESDAQQAEEIANMTQSEEDADFANLF